MPELKKIRVREAKDRDIGLFKKLWMKLLEQNNKDGSIIVPSEESLSLFESLFKMYISPDFVEQHVDGIVLFVADKAVLMWGADTTPIQRSPGKLIIDWGYYIEPDSPEGIEEALLKEAEFWAKKLGYSGVVKQFYKQLPEKFEPWATVAHRLFDA